VDRDLFGTYCDRMRAALAQHLGCRARDFLEERLTVVDRPPSAWPYTLTAATFGTGTVLSIDPAYRDFVDAHSPPVHYHAAAPSFLASVAAEGERRGHRLTVQGAVLLFTTCDDPGDVQPPAGYSIATFDRAWMHARQNRPGFERGVGRPGDDVRESRNRFAVALLDASGEPAAVAGVFETYGMLEIGLDVARSHRGRGLSTTVTRAAARVIIDEGAVPLYGCAATNVRSHRTAESAGFAIAASDAVVFQAAP
jgi:hypothetical protein